MSDRHIAGAFEDEIRPRVASGAEPYGWIGLPLGTFGILALGTVLVAACGALAFGAAVLALGFPEVSARAAAALVELQRDPTSQTGRFILMCLSIVIYLAIALAVVAFAWLRAGRAWRDIVGWHAWNPGHATVLSWIIVGATLVFSLVANEALAVYYPPSQEWVTLPEGAPSLVLFFVLAAICAPLTEELFFRGWLYTGLRAKLGRGVAVAISSILFAAAHYEATWLYALAVLPVGFALGVIRERESSLKASIGFHSLFNSVAFALIWFGV